MVIEISDEEAVALSTAGAAAVGLIKGVEIPDGPFIEHLLWAANTLVKLLKQVDQEEADALQWTINTIDNPWGAKGEA